MIRIGPAGWNYKDWEGVVYPKGSKVDQLGYVSQFFDAIEINNTFYRPPTPKNAQDWLKRIEHNPKFKFTLKLYQNFTHQRQEINPAEVEEWKTGIGPLLESNRLGAVLVQFPWSFKHDKESRDYLLRLTDTFSEEPLVVEFRHRSWNDPGVLELLEQLEIGICNIDQPIIGQSIRPHSYVTSKIGYLRCHGRNYRDWFRKEAGRDARYSYLYTADEIDKQVELVKAIDTEAEETYAIYNNHPRGQAAVNALQLRALLEGKLDRVPEPLVESYPEIKEIL